MLLRKIFHSLHRTYKGSDERLETPPRVDEKKL
jgi:hypothetical protein